MVTLSRIYTRTGDDGSTALGTGARVAKDCPRVEAYGDVDELNAAIGIARLHTTDAMSGQLAMIQNELFDLGADLCCPTAPDETHALRMLETQVTRLEVEMDQMNLSLSTLKSFVLPGGSPLSAHLHLARTVARRAERRAHTLARLEPVNAAALNYLNRLSDWLFVASRMANLTCDGDVLWEPGATRRHP